MPNLEISDLVMKETINIEKDLFISYGTAASEAMFDFPCNFFRIPECSGVVAYRIESQCAVVFGEPLCPSHEKNQLLKAFHEYCQKVNLNDIYVIISQELANALMASHCSIMIESSKELIIDPDFDPIKHSNRFRHRVEKAIKHGLTVHEYIPFDQEIETALKEIGIKWQAAIKGPHIYLGHLNFFENYAGKRWFYVKDKDEITSMVMLSRLDGQNGWLLKFLITAPTAVHDTSEFLMTSILDVLRKENCRFLSKGMIPADILGEVKGLGSFKESCARVTFKFISWMYRFHKRKEYWLRYNPQLLPTYLVFGRSSIGINEMKALMKIFRTSHSMQ